MRYCPYFCEETVWHLCRDDVVKDAERVIPLKDRRAVFVSNDRRAVSMDHQKAGAGKVVVWDYHVVLFALARSGWQCWDLDHDGGAPRGLADWLADTFTATQIDAPRFRVIDAEVFVGSFSSDRGHMRDDKMRPTRPFPQWDAIGGGASNLMRFVDTRAAWVGDVLSFYEVRLLAERGARR